MRTTTKATLTTSILSAALLAVPACAQATRPPTPEPAAPAAAVEPLAAPVPAKVPQPPLPPDMPGVPGVSGVPAPPPPRKPNDSLFAARIAATRGQGNAPAIIATEPIAPEDHANLTEDLNVMDRLLSEQTMRTSGEITPHAMGIKLMLLAPSEPAYIEGLGALFSYRVSVPLGPGKRGGSKEKPAGQPSAWERARREVVARGSSDAFNPMAVNAPATPAEFDQAKLDQLISGIIRILPEATNMRRLGENEFVVVTIVGTDADGAPMRLTIKARKADIDQAGRGEMPAEEFDKRVARRLS